MKRPASITIAIAALMALLTPHATHSQNRPTVSSIVVNGSIAPEGGVPLDNLGHGIWSKTISLDRKCDGQYFAHNIWFTVNDSINYKRCLGSKLLTRDIPGALCEGIRLNNGIYTITVDTDNFQYSVNAPIDTLRISVFGSSVANGEGAPGHHGYARMFNDELAKRYANGQTHRPFHMSGIAIGGNTTTALLNRYDDLLNDFGQYALIGLSMGNEGVHEATDKNKVFTQFRDNMTTLINRIKSDRKIPVVVNNYTRADYTPEDYSQIKRINMLIHQWDVASVNVLGAIDDGHGRWADGYINDPGHPDGAGHREFMHAIVPSLFDAIADGKPQPSRDATATLTLKNRDSFTLIPESTLHPFTITVRVRGAKPGNLMCLSTPTGNATVTIDRNGAVTYTTADGNTITSAPIMNDGKWHDITLTHYHARGCTQLYADTAMCGEVHERISPRNIVFGDPHSKKCARDFAEIAFWRAGMNADEIAAHHTGAMLKSSLELYSPMRPQPDGTIPNLAQSCNALIHTN